MCEKVAKGISQYLRNKLNQSIYLLL